MRCSLLLLRFERRWHKPRANRESCTRARLDPLPSSPALEAQPVPGRLMRRTKQDVFEWMDTGMNDLVTYLLGGQRPVVFYVLSYLENTDTKILE